MVTAGTGWPNASILWLGETASLTSVWQHLLMCKHKYTLPAAWMLYYQVRVQDHWPIHAHIFAVFWKLHEWQFWILYYQTMPHSDLQYHHHCYMESKVFTYFMLEQTCENWVHDEICQSQKLDSAHTWVMVEKLSQLGEGGGPNDLPRGTTCSAMFHLCPPPLTFKVHLWQWETVQF